jgi:hypothetical protein
MVSLLLDLIDLRPPSRLWVVKRPRARIQARAAQDVLNVTHGP